MDILIIDDDPDYQGYLRDIIRETGATQLQLDFVSSAEHALQIVNGRRSWDHYLVDWRFLGSSLTGNDIIGKIYQSQPEANVALCTGYEPVALEQELLAKVSNGRVSLLRKMGEDKAYLQHLVSERSREEARVLILDDDAEDAESVAWELKRLGKGRVRTDIASSHEEAFEKVAETAYHGFVLDYRLNSPLETGIDFYKSLDASQRRNPTALITGITHLQLDVDTLELIANGHIRFISKTRLNSRRLSACFEDILP